MLTWCDLRQMAHFSRVGLLWVGVLRRHQLGHIIVGILLLCSDVDFSYV
jgi:hypothetical protein